MIFEYMCTLARQEVVDSCSTEQWTGQYHRYAAIGDKKKADSLRDKWRDEYLLKRQPPGDTIADPSWQNKLKLLPTLESISHLNILPTGSFFIQFTFTLQKPYLSRDDNDFHIIDNPIVRDKVFRWPMVRPSAWKGSLRHALWQLDTKEDEKILRIFGTANEDKPDEGKRGRLIVYPTFFTESGLEVINPHDRKIRTGKNPILMECVPKDASGTFSVLYVPFDLIGKDEGETKKQMVEDLKLITKGLNAMLTVYGFGAKTSSGFGTAADQVQEGHINVKLNNLEFPEKEQVQIQELEDSFIKYMDDNGCVKKDFQGTDDNGLMTNSEYKKAKEQSGGGSLSEFKRFRNWYKDHGNTWQCRLANTRMESQYPTCEFESLSNLVTICKAIDLDQKDDKEGDE